MRHLKLILYVACYLNISCSTYQSISKRQEPKLEDIESKVRPPNKYVFYLNSGIRLQITVTKVDSIKVYGKALPVDGSGKDAEYDYVETKQTIADNTKKIKKLKIDPYWTGAAILIPIGIIVYWIETFTLELDNFSM